MKLYLEQRQNNTRFYIINLPALHARIQGMTKEQAENVLYHECIAPVRNDVYKISAREYVERCAEQGSNNVNKKILENYLDAKVMIASSTINDISMDTCRRIARAALLADLDSKGATIQ